MLHLHRLNQFDRVVRLQVLDDALRDQRERAHDAKREQYPERPADQVYPEIPDGLHLAASDPANEGNRKRNAYRRGNKVVIGKPGHLREIAHGGLARVGLPVRIGGERGRGVERNMRRAHSAKFLRIEWQVSLQALHCVQNHH